MYLKAGKAWKCLSPAREQPYLPLVKKKELPLLSMIQNIENVRNNSVIALRWVLIRLDRLKILPLSWRTLPSRTRSTQYGMVMTYRLAIESTRLHDVRKLTKQEPREKPQKQAKLTVNPSMSTVRPAPLLLCLVHLDMRNKQSIHIQTFHLKDESNMHLRRIMRWDCQM